MTFLQLCQRLREEAGISGSGPSTVLNQTGVYATLVRWVQRAYAEIQFAEPRWDWLWVEGTFDTVVGQRDYDPVADLGLTNFNQWEKNSLYVRRPVPTQRWPLQFMEFEVHRHFYVLQQTEQVLIYTFTPNKKLRFDYMPNAVETVEFEYWRKPFQLVNDLDEPAFPEQYHDIILYKALMYYAANEEAAEIYGDAQANYTSYLERLRDGELSRPYVDMVPLA